MRGATAFGLHPVPRLHCPLPDGPAGGRAPSRRACGSPRGGAAMVGGGPGDQALSDVATVFWGVASAFEHEQSSGLLERAEAALDAARTAQDTAIGCHEGQEVRLYAESSAPVA